MSNTKQKVKLHLFNELTDYESYIEQPFIVFEKHNFLDNEIYKSLLDEVYSYEDFDYIFSGVGEKKKRSINGSNVNQVNDGVFKNFCTAVLDKGFYQWFKKTHLPFFENKKLYFYTKKPLGVFMRLFRRVCNSLKLPITAYYTEIEYSSIKQGGYIPPHTDSLKKRLSFVFYLPTSGSKLTDEMKKQLGTVFWRPKGSASDPLRRFDCALLQGEERDKFYADYEPLHTSLYEPNKIAAFIKSDNSWHSVERINLDYDRRAIVINVWEV